MATRTKSQQKRARAQAASAGRRRRKRKRNRTLHYILLVFFLGGTLAVLSFTVFFKIENIEVIGAIKYSPDEIARASGVVAGGNLLRIQKEEISGNLLESFPYIETVRVRRKPPYTVEITVTQAQPIGAILQGDETLLISAGGKVLERGVILVPEQILVVRGIDAAQAVPGDVLGQYTPPETGPGEDLTEPEQRQEDQKKQLAEETKEKIGMLRYLLLAMEESGFERLTNVDLTDRLNMQIRYENRILMNMGSEAELADKLKLCKYIIEEQIEPDAEGTLTPELSRRRVYFRRTSLSEEEQEEVVLEASAEEEQLREGREVE